MEQLKLKYEHTKKAIQSLRELLNKHEELEKLDPMLKLVTQESLIKRFEYSIDTLWKYLKVYLKEKKGIDQKSPKPIFKEFLKIEILNEDETKLSLKMIDDRNSTSHTYNAETAEEISSEIPKYCELMENILHKTSN
jgi:nucleotidyltransferase substrate binding protein (TIGR01987 family)